MTTIILLNALGIILFYMERYRKRRTTDKFSFKFWIVENWIEGAMTVIINAALLIILLQPETNLVEYAKTVLPVGLNVAVPHLTSFAMGLGLSWSLYEVINKWIG